ncbi:wax ester/triacylglycerol synthase family O-acyltransferase [Sinimarinibacterium sp. CAU 1509]|uniref:WS/DGAT/MGAT family O-acyltransferase n=1 Tax=Sinimarinibacterium sp. CAU 1509 TaxID=2562283 RepID=UPI0010ACCBB0|nr:wax ester/triacylglycerol synthase family O-acyltransferase [Sinimarinibacterium sp. CAU 1509]TJY64779.1 wax ester/triacylglycerol synthase family O-acyltransferase [Sinimarinibacterium sp. CAU 1509]
MKRMSPLDAAWLYVDTVDTPMHVGSLTIFSLPPKAPEHFLRDMVAQLREVQTCAAPFNLKLRSARLKGVVPSWVEDDEIDLDYHFRHSALPQPGGERELGVLVSRLHSHPMDFNRPLWEMHVIEGLEHGRFALYMKMHHSLVDGVGGMRILQRILSDDPNDPHLLPPWAVGSGGRPRGAGGSPSLGQLQRLISTVRQQAATVPGVSRAFVEVLREAVRQNLQSWALPFAGPKSVLNDKVSGQRRFATQHYALDRIRAVAKGAGVTVNDVFLGLCSAAMRHYLLDLDALPEKSLTAGVPVSVRPADDGESANAISFIIARLNTDIADPIERLHAIHESALIAKEHLQKLPKADISNYTMIFMAPFILQLIAGLGGRARPMFNVTISNVPGPDRPLYYNGARLEQMYPVSLLSHGQALNITVVSYNGQFNVGFTGCRDTLPSMQRLAVYMGDALDELEAVLGLNSAPEQQRTKAPAKKRSKRSATV